ncbi:flavin reductase like domain-containing protein [Crepidotus variabilis]|uniref:Flavin reductase like domain-containing protein n=1 Tax=Crepidotus variabilis TaxID=179855 RepID=A0A9P6EA39_9AGAR|nr:flavin reductase like domain-containing protein [Crepidotus variabilis]
MLLTTTFTRGLRQATKPCRRAIANAALAQRQESPSAAPNVVWNDLQVKNQLRGLFRNIAQPVAVITSFMPTSSTSHYPKRELTAAPDARNSISNFHGATLSSFTSIAMDPYPLVTFALRVPSRMATTLNSLPAEKPVHMVINVLESTQSTAAVAFSRPDLHPKPFETCEATYSLSEDGLPVLHDVVGAISCQLVGRGIPLHDMEYLAAGNGLGERPKVKEFAKAMKEGDVTSQLFVARVVRVENVGDPERTLPLVYHRRGYTTCSLDT